MPYVVDVNLCQYVLGGCPHSRIENNQLCEQYRYNVGEFMQAYADAVLKQERGMHHENFSATCDSEM